MASKWDFKILVGGKRFDCALDLLGSNFGGLFDNAAPYAGFSGRLAFLSYLVAYEDDDEEGMAEAAADLRDEGLGVKIIDGDVSLEWAKEA